MATVAAERPAGDVATSYLLQDDDIILLNLHARRARMPHPRPRVSLTALA